MRTIFHIATKEAWAAANRLGHYAHPSLVAEGFIHFSRPHQIEWVARTFYEGRKGLLLLQVAQERVVAEVRYEGDAADPFPHVYGNLNLDAVVAAHELAEGPEGFRLPAGLILVGDALVRIGAPGDEAEIANVHTHAWLQTYRGLVPDAFLDERPLTFRQRLNWWRKVVSGKDAATVFVAESAKHGIVAFCAVQSARDKEFAGYGEIGAIYALREYKGKGLGAALFLEGRAFLAGRGMARTYLWVLEGNPTVGFYEKMGGRLLPATKFVDFGKPLKELAYEWA
jgi:uncharacterized protein (DUF952 family)/GNAT superfamily N-acetyltransferase